MSAPFLHKSGGPKLPDLKLEGRVPGGDSDFRVIKKPLTEQAKNPTVDKNPTIDKIPSKEKYPVPKEPVKLKEPVFVPYPIM